MVETWGLVEENARAIDYLHLEVQITKCATMSCFCKIHAATKKSIAKTFKVTKQSFETATHSECKAHDCNNAVLEIHG